MFVFYDAYANSQSLFRFHCIKLSYLPFLYHRLRMKYLSSTILIVYLLLLFKPAQSQPLLDLTPDVVQDGVEIITGFMKSFIQFKSNFLGTLLGKRINGEY